MVVETAHVTYSKPSRFVKLVQPKSYLTKTVEALSTYVPELPLLLKLL